MGWDQLKLSVMEAALAPKSPDSRTFPNLPLTPRYCLWFRCKKIKLEVLTKAARCYTKVSRFQTKCPRSRLTVTSTAGERGVEPEGCHLQEAGDQQRWPSTQLVALHLTCVMVKGPHDCFRLVMNKFT